MNNKLTYGAIAITFIVAVLALFGFGHSSSKGLGALSNYGPALGVTQLAVGSGCDQSYTSGSCLGSAYPLGTVYAASGLFEGGVNSTSTPASMTMTWTDFNLASLLSVNPSVGSVTMTLPATTTAPASFLPNVGDSDWLVIHNSTSTAATNVTIAGGTGSKLQIATSTNATTMVLQPGISAECRIFRKVNTDIAFLCVSSQN